MIDYYMEGDIVLTPHGFGDVIKDLRVARDVEPPSNQVWVKLRSGDNPQRYRAEELS